MPSMTLNTVDHLIKDWGHVRSPVKVSAHLMFLQELGEVAPGGGGDGVVEHPQHHGGVQHPHLGDTHLELLSGMG